MTPTMNKAHGAANCIAAPEAEKNICANTLLSVVNHNSRQQIVATHGTPKWKMDSFLEETDRRALERAENEGMI